MTYKKLPLRLFLLAAAATGFIFNHAEAASLVFTIDPAQSQVALSGTVAGSMVQAQGTGSLSTSYQGVINADVGASTIQFTGSSVISAMTNGSWQPGTNGTTSSIADYGAKASTIVGTAFAAARNVLLDVTSATLALTNGTGAFDSSQLVFAFPDPSSAELDYTAPFVGSGSKVLSGISTNTPLGGATLTTNGSVKTLTIQINASFPYSLLSSDDTLLTLTGELVATNGASAGPAEPVISSFVVTNHNLSLSVQNATGQSQLQGSADLRNWSPATANMTSNGNTITYTLPVGGSGNQFFRVKK